MNLTRDRIHTIGWGTALALCLAVTAAVSARVTAEKSEAQLDARKIAGELNWQPRETFESGLERTVQWYLDQTDWIAGIESGAYKTWIDLNYGARQQ